MIIVLRDLSLSLCMASYVLEGTALSVVASDLFLCCFSSNLATTPASCFSLNYVSEDTSKEEGNCIAAVGDAAKTFPLLLLFLNKLLVSLTPRVNTLAAFEFSENYSNSSLRFSNSYSYSAYCSFYYSCNNSYYCYFRSSCSS